MVERLTAAMEEAYAAAPADKVILHMVSLDHVSFPSPINVIMGAETDVTVTLEDGVTQITLTADPDVVSMSRIGLFDITPPGFSDDGPTDATLRVDNVSGKLRPYLKDAMSSGSSIDVTYRSYRSDVLTVPGEVIEGMKLKSVRLRATYAEGTLTFEEVSTQAFPLLTYDRETYPGLWNL